MATMLGCKSKQWKRGLRLRDTAGPSAGSSHPLVEAITGTTGINDQTAWGRQCGLDFGPPISSQHRGGMSKVRGTPGVSANGTEFGKIPVFKLNQ